MVEPMEVDIKPDIIEQPVLQSVLSEEEKRCSICLDDFTNKKILDKCTHPFCTECIELHFTYKPTCPVCGTVYGKVTGTQPDGTITILRSSRRSLPGHEPHGYISVSYDFPDGTQTVNEFEIPQIYYSDILFNYKYIVNL